MSSNHLDPYYDLIKTHPQRKNIHRIATKNDTSHLYELFDLRSSPNPSDRAAIFVSMMNACLLETDYYGWLVPYLNDLYALDFEVYIECLIRLCDTCGIDETREWLLNEVFSLRYQLSNYPRQYSVLLALLSKYFHDIPMDWMVEEMIKLLTFTTEIFTIHFSMHDFIVNLLGNREYHADRILIDYVLTYADTYPNSYRYRMNFVQLVESLAANIHTDYAVIKPLVFQYMINEDTGLWMVHNLLETALHYRVNLEYINELALLVLPIRDNRKYFHEIRMKSVFLLHDLNYHRADMVGILQTYQFCGDSYLELEFCKYMVQSITLAPLDFTSIPELHQLVLRYKDRGGNLYEKYYPTFITYLIMNHVAHPEGLHFLFDELLGYCEKFPEDRISYPVALLRLGMFYRIMSDETWLGEILLDLRDNYAHECRLMMPYLSKEKDLKYDCDWMYVLDEFLGLGVF